MTNNELDAARPFPGRATAKCNVAADHDRCEDDGTANLMNAYDLAYLAANQYFDEDNKYRTVPAGQSPEDGSSENAGAPSSRAVRCHEDTVIRFQPVTALRRFSLDERKVGAMVAALGDDLADLVPRQGHEEPADAAMKLFEQAYCTELRRRYSDGRGFDAITGDPRLELELLPDDDIDASGIYVMVKNRGGDAAPATGSSPLRLTTGWTELSLPDPDAPDFDPAAELADLLGLICSVANTVLEAVADSGRSPATAALRGQHRAAIALQDPLRASGTDKLLLARGWHPSAF